MIEAMRSDEFDVDFDDTREFVTSRFSSIIEAIFGALIEEDQLVVQAPRIWQDISTEIRRKKKDPSTSSAARSLLYSIQPLPRSIVTLNGSFISLVAPYEPKFDFLWGMVYLNLKLSYSSTDKLKRTVGWLASLRRAVELFNRCNDVCNDKNEQRLAMIDVYDDMFNMLKEALQHLRRCSTDEEAEREWSKVNSGLSKHLAAIDSTVKYLNEITNYSANNLQANTMAWRHALLPDTEELAEFPCIHPPFQRNDKFYGRKAEMEKMARHLSPPEGISEMRTYTLYGRRGVGKTEIALQYAYTNPSGFDAIFWIQCETSVSIRQSFTEVALHLKLPNAQKTGRDEENLLAVQKWLKFTKKRWLLIFDNAERGLDLKSYLPAGARGAILVASREHHNLTKDNNRNGDTIKPFDEPQSLDLLMILLGPNWESLYKHGQLRESEINAAKTLLQKIGGLALAIQLMSILINDSEMGDSTIASTLKKFDESAQQLPTHPDAERSEMVRSLGTLWNMSFSILSLNARNLLSVLAMLSPDSISIDVFQPAEQSALNGKLSFLKRPDQSNPEDSQSDPANEVVPPSLDATILELLEKRFIRKDDKTISVHRVVQEAMDYHSIEDLQESFGAAVQIVYEAFPKAWTGDLLHKQWPTCQIYITHGVHICAKYKEYSNPSNRRQIRPTDAFTALIANCAWYLYEIGDYKTSLELADTASDACEDKKSSRYSNLRNTAGACYFDMNRLQDCRRDYEIALAIQESESEHANSKFAYMYHNMGNLETGSGKYEEALEYYNKAVKIRKELGENVAGQMGLTYLCIGRLYYFRGSYDEAMSKLAESEGLFVRSSDDDTHFMAFVHFIYGNIYVAKRDWEEARRAFGLALAVALKKTPVHYITSAIYYKLGCVDLDTKNSESAMDSFEKALDIASLLSPSRDDGNIARILFKMAKLLETNVLATDTAVQLRNRADVARNSLTRLGEGQVMTQTFDENGVEVICEEEDAFDALVPIFFR